MVFSTSLTARQWPSAAATVVAVALTTLLLLAAAPAAAVPTKESHLHCSPTETEPYSAVHCVINVRDAFQEPTMNFNPALFSVVARASNSAAVVTTSEMARGTDITTAVFTLTASTGTDVLIRVFLKDTATAGTGAAVAEIRGSGITVSVLSWPATHMGPLSCTATETGLSLRSSTTCRAFLYDSNNAPSVLHSSDVIFSEANVLGSFTLVSGTRELVFLFTAPASTPVVVSTFTLRVRIRGQDIATNPNSMQSIQVPLQYPALRAVAAYTGVRCATETRPITCSITASDAQGPVAFNASQYRIRVERLMEGVADTPTGTTSSQYWVDTTDALIMSVRRSDSRPWVGVLQWEPRVKDAIFEARLRVQTSASGAAITGSGSSLSANTADVAGSPFSFIHGVLPNAQSVTLRGCRTSVIASGNATMCFIDLANNVAGDAAYYTVTTSQRRSSVSNFSYVDYDELCQCRSLWFAYHAPTSVSVRVDDFINVTVFTDFARAPGSVVTAMNVPYRLNVFPVVSGSGHDASSGSSVVAIVVFGFFFYGGVLGAGGFLILRRSRKAARIRTERAIKAGTAATEMAAHAGGGGAAEDEEGRENRHAAGTAAQAANTGVTHAGRTSPAPAAAAAASTGDWISRNNSTVLHNGTQCMDGDVTVSGRGVAPPPMTPTAVVSNAAVMQDRFHSDSD